MPNKLEYIQNLNFFSELNSEQLSLVHTISNIVKHPKGAVLYYENEQFDKIFFLATGLLKVYKMNKYENEIFLYHVYNNSLISELTTLNDSSIHCFANAEFMEDSVILEVNFSRLKSEFLAKNILNDKFINEILLKTQQLHCVVNRELVFDATAKVAFMLMDDLEMFNRLKRQEVSFMLHIQPETLSRVLKKLQRATIIDIEHAHIMIKDEISLKSIYRGNQ